MPHLFCRFGDSLVDLERAVNYFGMMELHSDVQRRIVINGHKFIWPENVKEI